MEPFNLKLNVPGVEDILTKCTAHQVRILELLGEGKSQNQIARVQSTSINAVKQSERLIRQKFDVPTRDHLREMGKRLITCKQL